MKKYFFFSNDLSREYFCFKFLKNVTFFFLSFVFIFLSRSMLCILNEHY